MIKTELKGYYETIISCHREDIRKSLAESLRLQDISQLSNTWQGYTKEWDMGYIRFGSGI